MVGEPFTHDQSSEEDDRASDTTLPGGCDSERERLSSEAVGWVFRHSPAKGATFDVHLAVADSVNDQHDNEFFMKMGNLAVKARCRRATASTAMSWLEERGFVELLSTRAGGRSAPARYRFLFPDVEVVYDSRKVSAVRAVTGSDTARSTIESARSADAKVLAKRARKEPKQHNPSNPRNARLDYELPEIVATAGHVDAAIDLCELLARHLLERGYTITDAAPRSKRWVLDMEQLLRLDGRAPDAVRRVLEWLQRGDDEVSGFWRTNVRSPAKLREKWQVMAEQYARSKSPRKGRGQDFGMDRDDVERIVENASNGHGNSPPPSSALSLPSNAVRELTP